MEKKGDVFNQLAIVSDLLEKINVNSKSQTLVLEVPENEFFRIYKMVETKGRFMSERPKNTFKIRIGDVNIVFNMSNA
jgi:hypothetical protein